MRNVVKCFCSVWLCSSLSERQWKTQPGSRLTGRYFSTCFFTPPCAAQKTVSQPRSRCKPSTEGGGGKADIPDEGERLGPSCCGHHSMGLPRRPGGAPFCLPLHLVDVPSPLRVLQKVALLSSWAWQPARVFPSCAGQVLPRT